MPSALAAADEGFRQGFRVWVAQAARNLVMDLEDAAARSNTRSATGTASTRLCSTRCSPRRIGVVLSGAEYPA